MEAHTSIGSSHHYLSTKKVDTAMSPLFQQVKTHIIKRIENGEWTAESRIPSENQIVEQFKISRSTAHRALRELTAEGYLVRVQGVGTFVAPRKPHFTLLEIRSIADEITRLGGTHSSDVHMVAEEIVTPELAVDMGIMEGGKVFHSTLVHRSNGKPLQIEDRYVNPEFAPYYLEQDFVQITPSEHLFQMGPLTEAEHTIEAIMPDENAKKLLEIHDNEPCLVIHRRTWSNEIVVTKAILIHPGTRFRPSGRFRPSHSINGVIG